jgi:hypothetical protein
VVTTSLGRVAGDPAKHIADSAQIPTPILHERPSMPSIVCPGFTTNKQTDPSTLIAPKIRVAKKIFPDHDFFWKTRPKLSPAG